MKNDERKKDRQLNIKKWKIGLLQKFNAEEYQRSID